MTIEQLSSFLIDEVKNTERKIKSMVLNCTDGSVIELSQGEDTPEVYEADE